MNRKFAWVVFALFCRFFLFAQTPSVRLGVLKGISCSPCAYLIANKEKLSVQNMAFKVFDSEQSEFPALLKGEIDMGFLAPENAAKVFSKGNRAVICVGVVQNGSLCLLTSDESYSSLQDLRGKKILAAGEKSDSVIFKHLLSKKEIPVDEGENPVLLDFSVPPANIANNLITKKTDYAILTEPYATVALKNSKELRRAENFQKIYNESEEWSSFPAMLLVVRADFAKENQELVRKVTEVYKSAIQWSIKNPSKAAILAEKHNLGLSEAVVRQSIPNAALIWRDAKAAKADIEKYLVILKRELPGEEFYF